MGRSYEEDSLKMMSTVVILLLLVVAVIGLGRLLRGKMEHPTNLGQLLERLHTVNAASFRHLASEADDLFLRKSLAPSEYRRLHRLRLRALRSYYTAALQNSSLLLSYADLLVRSGKPELVEVGQQLSPIAVQLRLALIRGFIGIFVCYLLPVDIPRWRQVSELYRQAGSHLGTFCEVHAPDLQLELAERFPV